MENIRVCGSICHSLSGTKSSWLWFKTHWPFAVANMRWWCRLQWFSYTLFMPVARQCEMQKCVFHRCTAGNLHLMCIHSNATYANCRYACAMFRLSSLFLGTALSVCVCVCLWLPGLLLFCSNGEHVVITVIYHNDGLALPPQRKQKLAAAWDSSDDSVGNYELSQARGEGPGHYANTLSQHSATRCQSISAGIRTSGGKYGLLSRMDNT